MIDNENLQNNIFSELCKSKIPVTLFLMNGFQLHGVIAHFDNSSILFLTDDKQQLIYKHAISTLVPKRPLNIR